MRRYRVYLASAISNGGTASPDERLANVAKAAHVAARLVENGFAPYCPALTEYIEILTRQRFDHDVWMACAYPWVKACDVLLRLPGESVGADMEIEYAKANGIPVVHTESELEHWAEHERQLD